MYGEAEGPWEERGFLARSFEGEAERLYEEKRSFCAEGRLNLGRFSGCRDGRRGISEGEEGERTCSTWWFARRCAEVGASMQALGSSSLLFL